MNVTFNSFVRRQTPESRFGHTRKTEADVIAEVEANFSQAKPGYRPGVCLVPVDPQGWFSATVELKEGDELVGHYTARRPGEEPRKVVGVAPAGGDYEAAKQAAVACDIVLYASTVLAEDGDNEAEAVEGNWEIISMNPRITVEDEPIHPDTLMANHFHEDGGTATGMTPAEFEAALRTSRAYWKSRATLA